MNDNFFWLTGFDQPMSAVVIKKDMPDAYTLFLRERNRRDIIYNGGEQKNEEIIAGYGAGTILPYSELAGLIQSIIKQRNSGIHRFQGQDVKGQSFSGSGQTAQAGDTYQGHRTGH
ncbi:MAG: aminopeptidase P N-terminal domain-containing protein [Marinilabiliales bacterium]|nr:aminopeptidase P N-terminal domain-containing protein [Marinilabiliales bacterium]